MKTFKSILTFFPAQLVFAKNGNSQLRNSEFMVAETGNGC